MEYTNLLSSTSILYAMSFFIALGFALPFLFKDSRIYLINSFTKFRPFSIFFVCAHSLLIIFSDFIGEKHTVLAQISIVSTMAFIYFEIRFTRVEYNQKEVIGQIAAISILFLSLEFITEYSLDLDIRFPVIALMLAVYSSFVIIEIIKKENETFQKFKIPLIFLVIIFLISVITRGYIGHNTEGLLSVHDEGGVLLFARVVMVSAMVLIFLTLNNFYFESLWRGEFEVRQGTEAQFITTLNALSKARDNETGNHTLRTKTFVKILADHLGKTPQFSQEVSGDYATLISEAAPLHDIGKIGIPDNILLKPGRLDAEEWKVMQTHASIGEEVLGAALDAGERSEQQALFLRLAREIAGSHHERWDGSGYPRGLAGTEIPLAARLMSVADCYDALRSRRPYKEPWSHEEAMEELLQLKGSAFCPHVIDAAVHVQRSFRETYDRYQD